MNINQENNSSNKKARKSLRTNQEQERRDNLACTLREKRADKNDKHIFLWKLLYVESVSHLKNIALTPEYICAKYGHTNAIAQELVNTWKYEYIADNFLKFKDITTDPKLLSVIITKQNDLIKQYNGKEFESKLQNVWWNIETLSDKELDDLVYNDSNLKKFTRISKDWVNDLVLYTKPLEQEGAYCRSEYTPAEFLNNKEMIALKEFTLRKSKLIIENRNGGKWVQWVHDILYRKHIFSVLDRDTIKILFKRIIENSSRLEGYSIIWYEHVSNYTKISLSEIYNILKEAQNKYNESEIPSWEQFLKQTCLNAAKSQYWYHHVADLIKEHNLNEDLLNQLIELTIFINTASVFSYEDTHSGSLFIQRLFDELDTNWIKYKKYKFDDFVKKDFIQDMNYTHLEEHRTNNIIKKGIYNGQEYECCLFWYKNASILNHDYIRTKWNLGLIDMNNKTNSRIWSIGKYIITRDGNWKNSILFDNMVWEHQYIAKRHDIPVEEVLWWWRLNINRESNVIQIYGESKIFWKDPNRQQSIWILQDVFPKFVIREM